MLERWLKQNYGIVVDDEFAIGKNQIACRRGNQLYFLIRPVKLDQEELTELQTMTLHLSSNGDRSVPLFFPAKDGGILSDLDNEPACVLVRNEAELKKTIKLGRSLGKFHYRGRSLNFPIKKLSRLGQWKSIWEKRLDQMEQVWAGKLYQYPENEFEKMFYDSYPYFMGLTENAIQYLVDTEIEEQPMEIDHGTICHERFTPTTWGGTTLFRNPFDWVLDHFARDLAEWTRARYFHNTQTYEPDLRQFFTEYQTVTRLSPFSWRLLYARLLFPIHYFECVEGYYLAKSEQTRNTLEDQMQKLLNHSTEYEKFLGHFYQLLEVPIRNMKIPEIAWLKKY